MIQEKAFRLGVSAGYIIAAIALWVLAYIALSKSFVSSVGMTGFTIVLLCAAVGSAVMLYGLVETLKLKLS